MDEIENVLEFRNITKKYPGVLALNNVSISFRKGEVHALVGENGAGKSTLIKSSTGAVIPTSGEVVVNNSKYKSMSPLLARENGIAVIYQEFNLVNDLSVAENVYLGHPIRSHGLINMRAMENESRKIFSDLGIDIDVTEKTRYLTTGYQQLVEIAKALSNKAKILIMDEPSASLSQNEVKTMFGIIHKLKKEGTSIVYISHRLDEIFEISDRVSVLRDGELITTLDTNKTNRQELISLMVGRKLTEQFPQNESHPSETILEVEHLSGRGVKDVSFSLHRGEILGFGGLIGAGRTETAQIICGVSKKENGKIVFKGKEINPRKPSDSVDLGIALAPEDRKKQGLLLHMSVNRNIAFPSYKSMSKFGIIDDKRANAVVDKYIKYLEIKTPSDKQLCRNLSGGNQQKVVLAKWLAKNPDVIILDEPTRGIDVAAKQEIYIIINKLVNEGKAIIIISSDMEELLGMSDRIVVFCEGKVTGEVNRDDFNQEKILTLASANN